MKKEHPKTAIDLDVRQFAKHVTKVGPERAFMDFLYGLFVVADEVMRTGINGKTYPRPMSRGK